MVIAIVLLLSATISNAQIKNAQTETAKIFGNCNMCKSTIEKAGNINKVAKVDWNKDTKMAALTYDSQKTNPDEILKRIALAGYDSEKFLAPDSAYNALHGCCQYDREAKTKVTGVEPKMDMNQNEHSNHTAATNSEQQIVSPLKTTFDNYFLLKDALTNTDSKTASNASKEILTYLNDVKIDALSMDVHMVLMQVLKDLKVDSKGISETQDIKKQRTLFISLSKNIYTLIKVSKYETPVYYQFCPMANGGKGANWLSKENSIKNPYYGSQMISCGKTAETINK